MNKEARFTGDDSICPFCGSEELEFDYFQSYNQSELSQAVSCNDCGKEWINHYSIRLEQQESNHYLIYNREEQ